MTPETLSGWVTDEAAREHYRAAFKRSDFDAMLAYYKRNYPDVSEVGSNGWGDAPNIAISTLVVHGLEDTALHSDGLNNTWDWIDSDLTILTVRGAGHFVQQDASGLVSAHLRAWLDLRREDVGD
jgi:pimeloyl-ACP methyl ester carboxylesterase